MQETHFELIAKDGLKLHGVQWNPEGTPSAVICLVHGHGEHIMRYVHVGNWFCNHGIAVIGMDLRGHGTSEGKRGHTPEYESLMDDVSQLLIQADKLYPGIPKFIYGHSMGGNIVSNFVLKRKPLIKGAILSAPWLRLQMKPPGFKVFLGRIMNGIFPAFTQSSGLSTKDLCRDKDVVLKYETDPLVHDKISARLGITAMDQGEWAIQHANEAHIPFLLMHGEKDGITSNLATKQFGANIKLASVQTNMFAGLFHEIHNEPEKEEVFQTTLNWINSKLV